LVDRWRTLIEAFVAGEMDAVAFERAYIDLHSDEVSKGMSIPFAADRLFYEVDAFCAWPELRGPETIDEAQLLIEARKALADWHLPWPPILR
jgi:hypothetical protein